MQQRYNLSYIRSTYRAAMQVGARSRKFALGGSRLLSSCLVDILTVQVASGQIFSAFPHTVALLSYKVEIPPEAG